MAFWFQLLIFSYALFIVQLSETYSEACETYNMEHFAKIINGSVQNVKHSILAFWICFWPSHFELYSWIIIKFLKI